MLTFFLKNQLTNFKSVVIDFPSQYLLFEINSTVLERQDFDVNKLDNVSDKTVKSFLYKLHGIVTNSGLDIGTSDSITDSMVMHLLINTLKMDSWPLFVR